MKAKIKLDKNAAIALLEEHAEKLVLGVFLLLALGIVYGAVAHRGRMDNSPEKLQNLVAEVQNKLAGSKAVTLEVRDYEKSAKLSRDPIDEFSYHYTALWTPRKFQAFELRGIPELLPVEGLRGTGEFGSLRCASQAAEERPPERPIAGPAPYGPRGEGPAPIASENIEGKWWVVLTAAVPMKKQTIAYDKVFQSSQDPDPQTDTPNYRGYYVQRLEMPPSGDTKNLDWSKAKKFTFSKTIGDKFLTDWPVSGNAREVAPESACLPALTFPPPPLVDEEGSEHWSHEPEIPCLLSGQFSPDSSPDATTDENASAEKKPPEKGSKEEIFGPGEETRPGEEMRPGGYNRPPMPGRYPGPYRRPGYGYGEEGVRPGAHALDENLNYYLFRYFDFEAEPGKTYVYRAQLVLANPNYKKKESVLKDPESAKKPFIETEWSKPTDPITVPLDTRVLVKSAKPSRRADGEPSAAIVLVKWMKDTGEKVYYQDESVDRGQVLNYEKVKPDPYPQGGYASPTLQPETKNEANLFSDILVLDISGGQRLPPGSGRDCVTAPAEVLLMDPGGGLSIRSELSDLGEVALLTATTPDPMKRGPEFPDEERPRYPGGPQGPYPPGVGPYGAPPYGAGRARPPRGGAFGELLPQPGNRARQRPKLDD
ncbi:MAG: hypothetical protein JXB10_14180 [Pirellulales bacterium]|nr:hypothetical protein [Pirellulales bacterium]